MLLMTSISARLAAQIFACLGGLILLVSAPLRAEQITITSGFYAPWSGKKLFEGGFINQLISEAFLSQGYKVTFRYLPWKRAYAEVKSGMYPASAYWYYSKDNERNFIHSDAIYTESIYFMYNKTRPLKHWETLDDLAELTIGATDGFTYTSDFWSKVKSKKLKVELTTSNGVNMRKLVKRRVDLVPIERHVAYHIVRRDYGELALKDIDFNPKPLAIKTDHLLFSRKHPDSLKLVAVFNKGLSIIKGNGKISELEERLLKGGYDKEIQ